MATIGEDTNVRLGVVGFFIMVFIGVLGFGIGAIWFASSMSTKLDQITEEVKGIRMLDARIYELESRVKIIESKLKP